MSGLLPLAQTLALALTLQGGTSHLVVVSGISGEPRYAESFERWGAALVDAARGPLALSAPNVVWLAEDPARDRARIAGRSTKSEVERALGALAERAAPGDAIVVLLIGHGSHTGPDSRLNLPGPDITAAEFARLLAPLERQRVAFVNTASASGDFTATLAAPNRIVVTATKTALERNETLFPEYFVAALTAGGADANKDGRVSLLEAFTYAQAEVARRYEAEKRLLTEHAVLDGEGLARDFYLASSGGGAPSGDPRIAALERERDSLQARVAALRERKASMAADAYETELERLLVALAERTRAIRATTGGEP